MALFTVQTKDADSRSVFQRKQKNQVVPDRREDNQTETERVIRWQSVGCSQNQ